MMNEDKRARIIANAFHDGQSSALYALASTGAIVEGVQDDIRLDFEYAVTLHDAIVLGWLLGYVYERGERGPIDGWSDIHWSSADEREVLGP